MAPPFFRGDLLCLETYSALGRAFTQVLAHLPNRSHSHPGSRLPDVPLARQTTCPRATVIRQAFGRKW